MPTYLGMPAFPDAAKRAVADSQLRRNLTHATTAIRTKRAKAVAELDDWEQLRQAAKAIKDHTLANLGMYLVRLEENVTRAGGHVHWARDAAEANAIVANLVRQAGADKAVKVKSMATQETGLNEALEAQGTTVIETDLAELIVQLGDDRPSHILVPAIHRNRAEIGELFRRTMDDAPPGLTDDPPQLAAAARVHLRHEFLTATLGISGANFAVADTGSLVVVESEGNGRMCLTLPDTLISVVGIEKVLPSWRDLEVFLALLPRSSTAERMNPYTTIWSGVTPGDGPQDFHLVLLDNGRTDALADRTGRQALRCIRCSACLNVCPVYERAGGHAYGSPYPGPIGAILSPQLRGVDSPIDASLPFASSLCGACYEVCPVAINIPEVLVEQRARVVESQKHYPERIVFGASGYVLRSPRRLAAAQRVASLGGLVAGRSGRIRRLPPPLSAWTETRDAPVPPPESFRAWWARNREPASERCAGGDPGPYRSRDGGGCPTRGDRRRLRGAAAAVPAGAPRPVGRGCRRPVRRARRRLPGGHRARPRGRSARCGRRRGRLPPVRRRPRRPARGLAGRTPARRPAGAGRAAAVRGGAGPDRRRRHRLRGGDRGDRHDHP